MKIYTDKEHPAEKYELDRWYSFVFTDNPNCTNHFVMTNEEAKQHARKVIESQDIKDYTVLVEKIHENAPNIPYGMKLYEIRIVK